MLFNSLDFILFFIVVTSVYFLLPHKFRWFHLLAASCFFYMCFVPVYILILFFTILIDYAAGILIEQASGERKKKWLVVSIIANVGVLAFFKYYNFFAVNSNELFHGAHINAAIPLLNIILPIGLSFHTFQAMSYTIEIYRENQKAEKHLGIYALYVMFYPQLVAGPIERPQNVLHQFHEKKHFDYDNFVSGMRLIMWGMIKKIVIADRLAVMVSSAFNDDHNSSGINLLIATFLFVFQVYCDFSGYSDIAVGTARVMGYKLMINFNRPFISRSISEYWRRWHISLATWFYDYVFNPFVATVRRLRRWAIVLGLFLTFFLSGLWHGASWTFIVWGILHSFVLMYEFLTKNFWQRIAEKMPKKLYHWICWSVTFSFLVLSAVFFRAKDMTDALTVYKRMSRIPAELHQVIATRKLAFLHLPGLNYIVCGLLLIAGLQIAEKINEKYDLKHNFSKLPVYLRWATYYAGLLLVFYFGVFEKHQFIYFQF